VVGVLILDKPAGPSSFAVLRRVRSLVWRSLDGSPPVARRRLKFGHGGTLDPAATGVLPICVGEATKLAAFLLEADKEYEATVRFGVATDSHDATGTVLATAPVDGLTEDRVRTLLAAFVGEVDQVPPMFSALKHLGRPLHAYAREGTQIERPARKVQIHELELSAWFPPDLAHLRVRCGKGTYVRALADDLGRAAATGAHLAALRRTASGPFRLAQAITLPELEACIDQGKPLPLVSPARALGHLPGMTASAAAALALSQGKRLPLKAFGLTGTAGGRVRILREDQTLLAVAELSPDGARPLRVFAHESLGALASRSS
jgi:tRNA pseudouridine55 synthase